MDLFQDDIATEVLLRLPPKSVVAFKCTAKRWNHLLSSLSFLRTYDERSRDVSGLLLQRASARAGLEFCVVNHIKFTQTGSVSEDAFMNFLPEKVIIIASSNGMLCCRSCVYSRGPNYSVATSYDKGFNLNSSQTKFSLYICNPTTKEWLRLAPKKDVCSLVFGFSFYPFGSSSPVDSSFKLVNLQLSQSSPDTYSFAIYSSETRKWKMSKEVCKFSSYVYRSRVIFCNGVFHWLTTNNQVVTFHLEKESSKVIKLPGITPDRSCENGICSGESQGYFHCVCPSEIELNVWILKDYEEPVWEHKYRLHFLEIYQSLFGIIRETYPSNWNMWSFIFFPYAFYEDVLYAKIKGSGYLVISYDFKSGTFTKIWGFERWIWELLALPYRASLLSLPVGDLRLRRSKRNKKQRVLEG